MTPSVMELQEHYRELKLPVVIVTGGDDQIADLGRQSQRLHEEIPRVSSLLFRGSATWSTTLRRIKLSTPSTAQRSFRFQADGPHKAK
jgi:hypothetical protein